MTKKAKTPMEEAQKFANNLVASLRLHHTLTGYDQLTADEKGTPENKIMFELLIKAIELSYGAEEIEA